MRTNDLFMIYEYSSDDRLSCASNLDNTLNILDTIKL